MNVVRTATRGPRPDATPEQVERVLDLYAAGSSLRGIALAVFGDRALYGRVRRLLRSTRQKTARERAADRAVEVALSGLDGRDALATLEASLTRRQEQLDPRGRQALNRAIDKEE